ncbi:MAG: hypothetical protein KKH94_05430 [Candidatus Omnitrophica bacterium]|nr:hypothetical protein [Candidatus Omnitrophota bacterium]
MKVVFALLQKKLTITVLTAERVAGDIVGKSLVRCAAEKYKARMLKNWAVAMRVNSIIR